MWNASESTASHVVPRIAVSALNWHATRGIGDSQLSALSPQLPIVLPQLLPASGPVIALRETQLRLIA
jgi:hypothetical protein